MSKCILDVGQCGVDGPRLGRFIAEKLHCTIDRAHSLDEAVRMASLKQYDLVLVNRILNNTRTPGMEVIAALRKNHPALPVMLVSDRPEAQAEAIHLGALKGFGKANLESPLTEKILAAALGVNT